MPPTTPVLDRWWKTPFLAALRASGRLTVALKMSDAPRSSVHDLRKADPEFDAAVRRAIADAAEQRRRKALARVREVFGLPPDPADAAPSALPDLGPIEDRGRGTTGAGA
jgi:hypothetical protein